MSDSVLTAPPTALKKTQHQGLTAAEVAERVARGETNNFKARVGRTYWDIVRDNIFNLFNIVFFALLVIVLYFRDYGTFFFAGFSVISNTFLGMIQEINAKRKLDQLAELSTPEVHAWRDGQLQKMKMEALVKDDIIPIEPGDRLVVDGIVLNSDALEIDESQLTGESDAVLKDPDDKLYSGSFVVAGSGVMKATEVGRNSTINKLSSTAKTYRHVLTPTQERINQIVRIAVIIMAICLPMIFYSAYVTSGNNDVFNLPTFRNAVVFVASIVPQGLVLTAILSLTIGAISISRRQTLVQRVNAVESMANVSVLCFDKTGTLTQNKLAVSEIIPLEGASKSTLENSLGLYLSNLSYQNRTAAAVSHFLEENGQNLLPAKTKTREISFNSARKWGAIVFEDETFIFGAPERVLNADDRKTISYAQDLSAKGMRVLAFARYPQALDPQVETLQGKREHLALIILSDQVRENIQETLQQFIEQDVKLKVISGDNLETVRAIAKEAGLTIDTAFTGDQLQSMTDVEFESAVIKGQLFARIEPETKRKIVQTLKRQGEYVAMTGDGVNDVPALKESHLAIVMNDGAQISKDVADIVLLNNAMTTLPAAFFEGRTITQTIFGTSKIFLVKNFYSILFFIFAGFMALPFPIGPIQISWMTFWVINVPATLIAFRIIKPAPMKTFRKDVLDYVVSGSFIGAVAMCILYGFINLQTNFDTDVARSSMMLFFGFYGLLVMWNVMGLDIFDPKTYKGNLVIFILGLILMSLNIIGPYIVPQIIEYTPPALAQWVSILVCFVVAAGALHFVMRRRILANLLWQFTSPP